MARCKNCGESGLFKSVNALGVCARCDSIIKITTPAQYRIYKDCCNIIENTENPETLKKRLSLLREKLQFFLDYENKGIMILNPYPSVLLATLESETDDYYEKCFNKAFNSLTIKVTELKTKNSQIGKIEKFIDLVDEYKNELTNTSTLDKWKTKAEKLLTVYST